MQSPPKGENHNSIAHLQTHELTRLSVDVLENATYKHTPEQLCFGFDRSEKVAHASGTAWNNHRNSYYSADPPTCIFQPGRKTEATQITKRSHRQRAAKIRRCTREKPCPHQGLRTNVTGITWMKVFHKDSEQERNGWIPQQMMGVTTQISAVAQTMKLHPAG